MIPSDYLNHYYYNNMDCEPALHMLIHGYGGDESLFFTLKFYFSTRLYFPFDIIVQDEILLR
ncbi:hypothetical protein OI69_08165 [Pectobacterium fontis]|uniref:Uncharacterized protein n=1 Tax=Pectobacterium fontis TaxID=2558042 RepID=A0A7V8L5P4_9GAMM|nr:hypothetical protein OI69_08165 [Pectobacterium fontis]